jgi:hypothetical protein
MNLLVPRNGANHHLRQSSQAGVANGQGNSPVTTFKMHPLKVLEDSFDVQLNFTHGPENVKHWPEVQGSDISRYLSRLRLSIWCMKNGNGKSNILTFLISG